MHFLAAAAAEPSMILLFLAVGLALAFEFVNGFHDTANAVATVIYTHALKPNVAVIWSGFCNLMGVLSSKGLVAFTIVALLPVELVLNIGSGAGFAMVFSLLVSAIIWNVGTWYLGLPASSSHTLIGSIIGVGMANAYISGHPIADGVNWGEVQKVGITLLVSPIFGFVLAALLLLLLKALVKNPVLFSEPAKDAPPPAGIRGVLIATCTGVSFFHGSNDGQKGMGLIVLILVGILPGTYALKLDQSPEKVAAMVVQSQAAQPVFEKNAGSEKVAGETEAAGELQSYLKANGTLSPKTYAALAVENKAFHDKLSTVKSFTDLSQAERTIVRTESYLVAGAVGKINKSGKITDDADKKTVSALKDSIDEVTKSIPLWVKVAVAIALGLGTTIGWKRIVKTVGEKIGQKPPHLWPGRVGGDCRRLHHRCGGHLRPSRQHHPRSFLRGRRYHGREPLRPPDGNPAQHPHGLGAHPARLHGPRFHALRLRQQRPAPVAGHEVMN